MSYARPSVSDETYDPSGLLAGDHPVRGDVVTILSGQTLVAGAVIGQITVGAVTAAARAGGNTGNGALTLTAGAERIAGCKVGVYRVRCIAAATNSGTFRVEDPDGFVKGDVAVGTAFADDIGFTIADGATDFVVGDGFDVTVAAGSGKWVLALAAANDGSQTPRRILAEAANAAAGDVAAVAYHAGDFIANRLTYGTGWTAATVETAFRAANAPIYLVNRTPK